MVVIGSGSVSGHASPITGTVKACPSSRMDAFYRLTTGGSSIEQFARDVYTKGFLSQQLGSIVKTLKRESKRINAPRAVQGETSASPSLRTPILIPGLGIPLSETSINAVTQLCDLLEASLLHGLKEKLTLNKITASVLGSRSDRRDNADKSIESDFWSIIQILCHHQVADNLKNLSNIYTDIGRCRSWIRITLNESLFGSYMEALGGDATLLSGFYKSSAYVRDGDNSAILKTLLEELDSISFQLNYDDFNLNSWSEETLKILGYTVPAIPEPVVAGRDALEDEMKKGSSNKKVDAKSVLKRNMKKSLSSRGGASVSVADGASVTTDAQSMATDANSMTGSMTASDLTSINSDDLSSSASLLNLSDSVSSSAIPVIGRQASQGRQSLHISRTPSMDITGAPPSSRKETPIKASHNRKKSVGNSLGNKTGWSSSSNLGSSEHARQAYGSMVTDYFSSCEVALSSTPDIRDVAHMPHSPPPFGSTSLFGSSPSPTRIGRTEAKLRQVMDPPRRFNSVDARESEERKKEESKVAYIVGSTIGDYEVIPKSLVLNNDDPEIRSFLSFLVKINPEIGLDQQDYKCKGCGRPIGLIYGKSRLDKFDGYNYCISDCHDNSTESVIPSRILYNYDFRRYPVSKGNHHLIQLISTEPLFDIKVSSPALYQVVPELRAMLDYRTQLFYLHGYIFTCAESASLELRKLVWPREHLFEHVHLYSLDDLISLKGGSLMVSVKKAIAYARKHVLTCALCSQKGFICELCKDPSVIYPFDTDANSRCEACHAVYHKSCCIGSSSSSTAHGRTISSTSSIAQTRTSLDGVRLPQDCPRCKRLHKRRQMEEF